MALVSKSPTIAHSKGTSKKAGTSVGSGSRPTKSKIKLATSAPEHPHHLGRKVAGSLK